jgi:hypothetical protein
MTASALDPATLRWVAEYIQEKALPLDESSQLRWKLLEVAGCLQGRAFAVSNHETGTNRSKTTPTQIYAVQRLGDYYFFFAEGLWKEAPLSFFSNRKSAEAFIKTRHHPCRVAAFDLAPATETIGEAYRKAIENQRTFFRSVVGGHSTDCSLKAAIDKAEKQ